MRYSLLAVTILFSIILPAQGQFRLMEVNDLDAVKSAFNADEGKVRVVALLSPT